MFQWNRFSKILFTGAVAMGLLHPLVAFTQTQEAEVAKEFLHELPSAEQIAVVERDPALQAIRLKVSQLSAAERIECAASLVLCSKKHAEAIPQFQDVPGLVGLVPQNAGLPSRETAEINGNDNSVSISDDGPQVSESEANGLRDSLRKTIWFDFVQGNSADSAATTAEAAPSFGPGGPRSSYRAEEGEGGRVPTSQDPANFPPNSGGTPADGGTPPAGNDGNNNGGTPPAGGESSGSNDSSPGVIKIIGTAIGDAWDRGWGPVTSVAVGIYDWLSGKPIVVRDEDPNAPAYREPTPEMKAAVQNLIGHGVVNPGNSDPLFQGDRSMENPDAVAHRDPTPTLKSQLQAVLGRGGVNGGQVDPAENGNEVGTNGYFPSGSCQGDLLRPSATIHCQ